VLAGVGIPGEPEEWQKVMLEGMGADGKGCSVSLAKSDPVFDWRLVAAVRVLCAESEREFEGMDMQRLGALDAPLSDKLEVPQPPHHRKPHAVPKCYTGKGSTELAHCRSSSARLSLACW